MLRLLSLIFSILFITACSTLPSSEQYQHPLKIAFLADIHFHDVYGELSDNTYQGIPTQTADGQRHALIRSMRAQLNSTRLFNENYFVLLAALDDLAARGIQLIALPGDFTDDGQPLHTRGLVKILQQYQDTYGMRFFAIPGNHDPVRPFTTESGKGDFLDAEGREFGIHSRGDKKCIENTQSQVVCSDDLKKWGYQEILNELADFGFTQQSDYLYYETPFGDDNVNFEARRYRWCEQDEPEKCISMPDASYLVEPIEGLWLLAIDANVYVPKDPNSLSYNGNDYIGSSNSGYNVMLQYKPEVIRWIEDVVQRAKLHQKQLIAFSHFPMVDFYDMAADEISALFGKTAHQLRRMPLKNTAKVLADTGLQVHVGGHMHINDTGTVKGTSGNVLFNIQAPTLAAYRPAYKVLTLLSEHEIAVDTIVVDEVPRFNELFPHYHKELAYLQRYSFDPTWRAHVLKAKNYGEFTDKHLTELVRQRYIPREWPPELVEWLTQLNDTTLAKFLSECQEMNRNELFAIWPEGMKGDEFINDFYRLRNADSIAEVSTQRKYLYQYLYQAIPPDCGSDGDSPMASFRQMLSIMNKFIQAQPSDRFLLGLTNRMLIKK